MFSAGWVSSLSCLSNVFKFFSEKRFAENLKNYLFDNVDLDLYFPFICYKSSRNEDTKERWPSACLHSLFSEKETSVFMKKLFANDLHHYNKFIRKLDELADGQLTFQTIDEEFQQRNINSFLGEAKKFSDKIFKQFY